MKKLQTQHNATRIKAKKDNMVLTTFLTKSIWKEGKMN